MSDLIVLDYSDSLVHIYHDINSSIDIEDFLYTKNDYKESEIEWMCSEELEIVHHASPVGAKFNIAPSEIEEMVEDDISIDDMKKILSYIENDEGIWEEIERAKREAIASVLK